ncbi:MAG TPA: hypothetical protein VFX89_03250 [Gammaproteobacteria bacterium]|nr:hypothetical protein [Gammaproteobacteria bacterium]
MAFRSVVVALAFTLAAGLADAQQPITYKSAIVALTDDSELRTQFEDTLAAKARAHEYDAVASHTIVPEIRDARSDRFLEALSKLGIEAVLMLRPAAVGAGSSLESVKNEVSPKLYSDMQKFAKKVNSSGNQDLIAVVHMAIYIVKGGKPELMSSGAVWLDEPVTDRQQAIDRLQNLMLSNVDAVRPAIRTRLGLPPLDAKP